MSKTVLDLLMTFDGYIAGEKDEIDWIEKVHKGQNINEEFDFSSFTSKVGAVITGYRSYKLGIEYGWFKNETYGPSPIFVLCHEPPENVSKDADFQFVTSGIKEAFKKAAEAAGEKWIYLFGGADVFQQFLNNDLVDEMHITIAPILIGKGIRLFDNLRERHIGLERISFKGHDNGMMETKYRIKK
jgi:dihydrofolate reductase